MQINNNIPALRTNSILNKTNKKVEKSLEKLSSGYKINKASDDAAGMAISKKLNLQIKALEQSNRNNSAGVSVIQTAEGALSEIEAMLQRIRELCVQAADDTYTAEDRAAIQEETNQLLSEIQRISDDTEFNDKILLSGDLDNETTSNNTGVSVIGISDTVETGKYKLLINADAEQAKVTLDTNLSPDNNSTIGVSGSIVVNGTSINVSKEETYADLYKKLQEDCNNMNIDIKEVDGEVSLVSRAYGSEEKIEISCSNGDLESLFGELSAQGKDVEVEALADDDAGYNSESAIVISKGTIVTINDSNGFELKYEVEAGAVNNNGGSIDSEVEILEEGPMILQLGELEDQILSVRIPRVDVKSLGLENLNLGYSDTSTRAIEKLDLAISNVSEVRSKLGAYQNRLDFSSASLSVTTENMTGAYATILDTDMAGEMTEYTQKNVLSQAGTSILAQANARPEQVLSLLQS